MREKISPFIITIGASAGGLKAVTELISQLPADINAAIFVVLHFSKTVLGDIFVSRIQKASSLTCRIAKDKDSIEVGNVYLAPPDAHLLIKGNNVIIGHGPPENRFRPSIDVLFRSAAASHGEKVTGIILTGLLNDGVIGMIAIKESGGYCIVQDSNEAEYPDMPLAVLESIEVDDSVSLKKMGASILKSLDKARLTGTITPPEIVAESMLSEKVATGLDDVSKLGKKTIYACPDCGGGLWSIENNKAKHYRCHIGHSYSENDLLIKQRDSIESTLWIAVRMMEERKILLQKISKQNDARGLQGLSTEYHQKALDLTLHIQNLKELLFTVNDD